MEVTGTLIWYYYICKREVWLMFHQIAPDGTIPISKSVGFYMRILIKETKKRYSLGM